MLGVAAVRGVQELPVGDRVVVAVLHALDLDERVVAVAAAA